jgi:hypothetical protein
MYHISPVSIESECPLSAPEPHEILVATSVTEFKLLLRLTVDSLCEFSRIVSSREVQM